MDFTKSRFRTVRPTVAKDSVGRLVSGFAIVKPRLETGEMPFPIIRLDELPRRFSQKVERSTLPLSRTGMSS